MDEREKFAIFRPDSDLQKIKLQNVVLLEHVLSGEYEFPLIPYVFWYTSGSPRKKRVALEATELGLITILPYQPPYSIHRPPERNPQTGDVEEKDRLAALSLALGHGYPTTEEMRDFPTWSVAKQAEVQALEKFMYDPNLGCRCFHAVTTDVRGQITLSDGRLYNLNKTEDPKDQLAVLEAIFQSGMIEGAVGVAVGHVDSDDILPGLDRWLQSPSHFSTASQRVRVALKPTSPEQIFDYIVKSQPQILASGWVLDVLGTGREFVKQYFIEDLERPGKFIEVNYNQAYPVIAGYPVDLIRKLLEKKYPLGNYQTDELSHLIKYARLHLLTPSKSN